MQKRFEYNLISILERVEKARLSFNSHHIVKLIAASKYVREKEIAALYSCGQRAFGENKVQDLSAKAKSQELEKLPLEWHFIGSLQTNKINSLLALNPHLFHALDSIELAEQLQKRLARDNKKLKALLQVNSAREVQKSGVAPENALEIYSQISQIAPNIELQGLMCIGAHEQDQKKIAASFELTRKIFEELQKSTKNRAEILSMGMSGDFELAIKCGANMIRLGSVLFK